VKRQDYFDNVPGKSTRAMAEERRSLRKTIGLTAVGAVFLVGLAFVAYLLFAHPVPIAAAAVVVFFLFFVGRIDRATVPLMQELFRREGHAIQGARAEEEIGALLDELAGNCIVLHDVNIGTGNLDHLVFRNDGAVFLIETKSHHGKIIQQNGQLLRDGFPLEKDFIGQTLKNVMWLKKFMKERLELEPWIHAVIVFTDAHVEKHLVLKGVPVINASFLRRWMQRQPGNPRVKARWPEFADFKSQLFSCAPIHLAQVPILS
jgi:hypothetical protein